MKICSTCKIEKHLNDFNLNKSSKDGYRSNCKDCRRLSSKKYYSKNKIKKLNYQKKYSLNNRDKINSYMKKYNCKRLQSDINYKLAKSIRTNLFLRMSGKIKTLSGIQELGCSIEELKKYLESRWQPDMNWDNWSKFGWHIDHIKPLASFNLENPEEFKKACHYTNLQPLWWQDNLRKSDYNNV